MTPVRLLQRLDEVDRRLGLHPRPAAERHAERWWRAYLGAAVAFALLGVALYLAGQSFIANTILGLPAICGLTALQGWGARRRRRTRGSG